MLSSTTFLSTSTLFLASLTSAANIGCFTHAGPPSTVITRDKLVQFKGLVDSGVVPPISVPQLQTQDVPLPGSDIKVCIQNPFLFESTTIFPDELSDFLNEGIKCFDRGQEPLKGELDGDTSLDIVATIVSSGVNCATLGS
jgi:hypothetical protein